MYTTVIISCISTACLTILAATTAGAAVAVLFDSALFLGMLLLLIPLLAAAGALNDFRKVFVISAEKKGTVSFAQLRNSLESVKLAIKIELLLGGVLSLAAFTAMIYNWTNLQFLGPNLFVFFAAPLYAFLFALCLFPVETVLRRKIFAYMDEGEGDNDDFEHEPVNESGTQSQMRRIVIVCIKWFFLVFLLIFFAFLGGTSLKNAEQIPLPVHVPSILGLVLFVFTSLAASGSFAVFCRFQNTQACAQKKELCETLDLMSKTLITSGGAMTLVGFIAVLNNLADKTLLVPSTYFALLPIAYGLVFALALLLIRARIKKEL